MGFVTCKMKVAYLAMVVFLSANVWSAYANAEDNIYTGYFGNTALSGYDAVSYFEKGKAEKGSKKFILEHAGVNWQFSSEAHLNLFKLSPEKYMPQYGGFCAWAVAEKKTRASGDPEYWKIVDDKLYLNYDKKVQMNWLTDIDGYIKQGDINWPKMLEE